MELLGRKSPKFTKADWSKGKRSSLSETRGRFAKLLKVATSFGLSTLVEFNPDVMTVRVPDVLWVCKVCSWNY